MQINLLTEKPALPVAADSFNIVKTSDERKDIYIGSSDGNELLKVINLKYIPSLMEPYFSDNEKVYFVNNDYSFTVTNYDHFENYEFTEVNGNISNIYHSKEHGVFTFTLTTISEPGISSFVLSGRKFEFLTSPLYKGPGTPTIYSMQEGFHNGDLIIETSEYTYIQAYPTDPIIPALRAQFQISSYSNFSTILYESFTDAIEESPDTIRFSQTFAAPPTGEYHARVRHQDQNGIYGKWKYCTFTWKSPFVRYQEIQLLNGEPDGLYYGEVVKISKDSSTIVIGSPSYFYPVNNTVVNSVGRIDILKRNGNSYSLFQTVNCVIDADPSPQFIGRRKGFGCSIDISKNGNIIVVGAAETYMNEETSIYEGSVYVYVFNGTSYDETIIRNVLPGYNKFGDKVSISDDGSRLVVTHGDYTDFNNLSDSSYNFTWFEFVNNGYSLVMQENAGVPPIVRTDAMPITMKLSGDGNILVIGTPSTYDSEGTPTGAITIYRYDSDMNYFNLITTYSSFASESYDQFGSSIDVNYDGTVICVSALYNGGNSYISIVRRNGDSFDDSIRIKDYTFFNAPNSPIGKVVRLITENNDVNFIDPELDYCYLFNDLEGLLSENSSEWVGGSLGFTEVKLNTESITDKELVGSLSKGNEYGNFGIDFDISNAGDFLVVGTGEWRPGTTNDTGRVYIFKIITPLSVVAG